MAEVPLPSAPGGFALGVRSMSALQDVGVRFGGWRWRYGLELDRQHPFEEHVELRGRYFEDLPTPDGWYPGDHAGCQCESVPVLRGPDGRFLPIP